MLSGFDGIGRTELSVREDILMRYLIVLSAIAFALGTVSIASTPAAAAKKAKAAKPAPAATAVTRAPARVAADTKSPMCKVIVPDQFLSHHRDYYRCW
jgi:hypothetical protein